MTTRPHTAFDPRALRQVLGAFATGVTVITTVDRHGRPHGLAANSFSTVSLDPPLVLWRQSLSARGQAVFREAERFVVNILAEDQVEVSRRFGRGGGDRFAGCATHPGLGGVPLIQGCAAWLECRRVNSFPGGDHLVFLGQVERIERTGRQPLVFGGGRYLVAQPHDLGLVANASGSNGARLKAVRLATRALVELSDELDETLGLGVWGNKGPTIVRWEESSEPVSDNLRTGLVLPVLTSATGLAFAAWLPREATAPFVEAELAQGLELPQVQQQLAQARKAGMVRLVGTDRFTDLHGTSISAASVPVFDHTGAMVLALTAIGATGRLDLAEGSPLVAGLRQCADALSQRLGGRSPAAFASNDPRRPD